MRGDLRGDRPCSGVRWCVQQQLVIRLPVQRSRQRTLVRRRGSGASLHESGECGLHAAERVGCQSLRVRSPSEEPRSRTGLVDQGCRACRGVARPRRAGTGSPGAFTIHSAFRPVFQRG